MLIQLGRIHELVRYPIKSMAGVAVQSASLGWHGLAGDRRYAFRRLAEHSGFPWLTAGRFPELIRYLPFGLDESSDEPSPTHVRTPAGTDLLLESAELQKEISSRCGLELELMNFKHGIFDDASVSMISLATTAGIGQAVGLHMDHRRFRANIVLDTLDAEPFLEDRWVGGTILFGDDEPRPAVTVTTRDVRCVMINLDPDTAKQDAAIMKTLVGLNDNNAGVYGTVVRTGTLNVGQPVYLVQDEPAA
jgi:uncharacterized protein YcbX